MWDESIKTPTTSNKMLNLSLYYVGTKIRVKFNEDWSKQEKDTFHQVKTVNIYIAYEIERSVNLKC